MPEGKSKVSGIVRFEHIEGRQCRIVAELTGLTPGPHGFHIHEFGNLIQGCSTAGPHFNPFEKTHGGPKSRNRHLGDLGNLIADKNGDAKLDVYDKEIELFGKFRVIGRSCVVHSKEDDLGEGGNEESMKTGNAGARVACGVIGLSAPF